MLDVMTALRDHNAEQRPAHGMIPLLYTVTETCLITSLSRATIYRLMGAGALDSVTIGRSRRITHDGLSAFLDSLRSAA